MINECSVENLRKYMIEIFENWHPLIPEIIQKSDYKMYIYGMSMNLKNLIHFIKKTQYS